MISDTRVVLWLKNHKKAKVCIFYCLSLYKIYYLCTLKCVSIYDETVKNNQFLYESRESLFG